MNTTPTTAKKVSLSFAGATDSTIANELAAFATVRSFSSPEGVTDALVIDGASAQLQENAVQQVLDRGLLVGFANPTTAHLSAIHTLTGAAPGGTPNFVALKKKGNRYILTSASSSENAVRQSMVRAGAAPVSVTPPAQSPAAVTALQSALGATPAGLLGDASLNFTAPQGAFAGTISTQETGSCVFGTLPCDNVTLGSTQTVTCLYYVDLYVYWVNGYPNTAPYYIVIQHLHGSAALGSVAIADPNSQGFCNVYIHIKPNLITDPSGNPLPGCSLLDNSPQTTVPGSATTATSQSFDVIGNNSQGSGQITVTASMDNIVNYPNWGVSNFLSGVKTSWGIYQSDGVSMVNILSNLGGGLWASNFWGSDNSLTAFPNMSFGTVPFDTVTVWKITDSSFSNLQQGCVPAPFSVGLYGEVDQFAVQDHNKYGCTLGYNHACQGIQVVPYWWNLDLDGVANRQNLTTSNS